MVPQKTVSMKGSGNAVQMPSEHLGRSDSSSHTIKHNDSPMTFKSAILARLDNPLVSLFRLGIRVLQLVFALASGISYAIELSHSNDDSAFIYTQVVFVLTLLVLIVDAITLRSYRLTFIVESTLCILWLALFGVFLQIYYNGDLQPEFRNVDRGRMKRAVWVDLINFLLWLASALFSTVMCCSGLKAMVKGKIQRRRARKQNKTGKSIEQMEEGIVRETPRARDAERLPLYEEIAAVARTQ